MFDPKAEVPSLELCQRLKELGFPQTIGGWYWTRIEAIDGSGDIWALDFAYAPFFPNSVKEIIKAPTCRELGEWLPRVIEDCFLEFLPKGAKILDWWVVYRNQSKTKILISADTEPSARAKMLIWLAENGYVKFERKEV